MFRGKRDIIDKAITLKTVSSAFQIHRIFRTTTDF